jgi:hypothetical protein
MKTRRTVKIIIILIVTWFFLVCGICFFIGRTKIIAGIEPSYKLQTLMEESGYLYPPSEDFYTGYQLLRIASTSPLFRPMSVELINNSCRLASNAAFMISGMLLNRVPVSWKPESWNPKTREEWKKLISWLEEHRNSFEFEIDNFGEPLVGDIEAIYALNDQKAVLVRRFLSRPPYLELVGSDGVMQWIARMPESTRHKGRGYKGEYPVQSIVANEKCVIVQVEADQKTPRGTICYDPNDGNELWHKPLEKAVLEVDQNLDWPRGKSVLLQSEQLIEALKAKGTYLVSRSLSDGRQLWSTSLPTISILNYIEDYNGYILLHHASGLTIVDSQNGSIKRSIRSHEGCCRAGNQVYYIEREKLIRVNLPSLDEIFIDKVGKDLKLTGMAGTYAEHDILVALHTIDQTSEFGKLILIYIEKETDKLSSKIEYRDKWVRPVFFSRYMPHFPESIPFLGELTQFVPIHVNSLKKGSQILWLDLEKKEESYWGDKVAQRQSYLFQRGSKYYLSLPQEKSLLVYDKHTDKSMTRVKTPSRILPTNVANDRIWVDGGNNTLLILNAENGKTIHAEGRLLPL